MKKELTIKEWKEIGIKAKEIRINLDELFTLLNEKLPHGQYLSKWKATDKAVDNMRNHLYDLVSAKFPNLPEKDILYTFFGTLEKE